MLFILSLFLQLPLSTLAVFSGRYTRLCPGRQKLGSLPFVCHPWMSWGGGGLGREGKWFSFGPTLLWSTNGKLTFRQCQRGTNLSNGQYRAPLPWEEIWRKVCIQCGKILTKFRIEIRKFFRAGVVHGFLWQKLPPNKQELEASKKKMMVNIVSSLPRHTLGNFQTARASSA